MDLPLIDREKYPFYNYPLTPRQEHAKKEFIVGELKKMDDDELWEEIFLYDRLDAYWEIATRYREKIMKKPNNLLRYNTFTEVRNEFYHYCIVRPKVEEGKAIGSIDETEEKAPEEYIGPLYSKLRSYNPAKGKSLASYLYTAIYYLWIDFININRSSQDTDPPIGIGTRINERCDLLEIIEIVLQKLNSKNKFIILSLHYSQIVVVFANDHDFLKKLNNKFHRLIEKHVKIDTNVDTWIQNLKTACDQSTDAEFKIFMAESLGNVGPREKLLNAGNQALSRARKALKEEISDTTNSN